MKDNIPPTTENTSPLKDSQKSAINLLEKLLSPTSPAELQSYESHLHLHLKQIMTMINKNKCQVIDHIHANKYQCFKGCYQYFIDDDSLSQTNTLHQRELAAEKLEQLRLCKAKCGRELNQIQKYLDDINFYAKKKMKNCSSSCENGFQKYLQKHKGGVESEIKQLNTDYNNCMWECYNKLDRRYKKYWVEQRLIIEAKYKE